MIVIGIDPDAEKHGVAEYVGGELKSLATMSLPDLLEFITPRAASGVLLSIENVMANNFVYARNRQGSTAAQSKVAMHIGRCQQAQVELMRWLAKLGIPYELHKPQKGNWADNKPQFEKVTGWKGRSNADTRAAAFFGYLALRVKN